MQSGQISASQLLASFLGSENEKIGESIAESNFASELKKHIPESPDPHSLNAAEKPWLNAPCSDSKAALETPAGRPGPTRKPRGSMDSRRKIDGIKLKAKNGENFLLSNPTAVDTVVADLQHPAETRKTCMGAQNKEGAISLKDLRHIMDTLPPVDSALPAKVPAGHVRALVDSIVTRTPGSSQENFVFKGNSQPSLQIKAEGSYTAAEFRRLLDQISQHADKTAKDLRPPTGLVETSPVESRKIGQTESLAATGLPSFVAVDSKNDPARKILSKIENSTPETKNAGLKNCENSLETVSIACKTGERLDKAEKNLRGRDRDGNALGMEAGDEVESGRAESSRDSAAAASLSASREAVKMPEDLAAALNKLEMKTDSSRRQEDETAQTTSPGDSGGAMVAQAQNLAPSVKELEKQTEKFIPAEQKLQYAVNQPGELMIKAASAHNASSEQSFENNPNQAQDPAQKLQGRALGGKFDPNEIAMQFQEDINSAFGAESEGSAEAGGKISGKAKSLIGSFGCSVDDLSDFEDQNSTQTAMIRNASALTGIDELKIAGMHMESPEQDAFMSGKGIQKHSDTGDAAPESVIFQNSTRIPGNETSSHRMENSAQGGSYCEPRSAEHVQNLRDQMAGLHGRQLVLEMEPDEFGKVSIKVGAMRDEISVKALTQNETARQVLMKHSPELRQDLQNQGLVLGKFTVDVNGEKQGGGNYPESNRFEKRKESASKTTGIGNLQTPAKPVYIKDSQSQISIFA